jgi:hypothetical protein
MGDREETHSQSGGHERTLGYQQALRGGKAEEKGG